MIVDRRFLACVLNTYRNQLSKSRVLKSESKKKRAPSKRARSRSDDDDDDSGATPSAKKKAKGVDFDLTKPRKTSGSKKARSKRPKVSGQCLSTLLLAHAVVHQALTLA